MAVAIELLDTAILDPRDEQAHGVRSDVDDSDDHDVDSFPAVGCSYSTRRARARRRARVRARRIVVAWWE